MTTEAKIPTIVSDTGYSHWKAAYRDEEGNIHEFEARALVVGKLIQDERNKTGYTDIHYQTDNGKRTVLPEVGVDAVTTKDDPDYKFSDTALIGQTFSIDQILKKANAQDIEEVDLITFLPIDQAFKEDGSKHTENRERKARHAKGRIWRLDDTRLVKIRNVDVVPEGFPAIAYVANHNKVFKERQGALKNHLVVLLDIGGQTTDACVTYKGDFVRKASARIGGLNLIESFSEAISEVSGYEFELPISELETLLKQALGDEKHQLHPRAMNCLEVFAESIKEAISGTEIKELSNYPAVILSGGCSMFFKDNANLFGENTYTQDKPSMHNVLGVYELFDDI